ncbi:hypothetical protein KP739_07400 [Streptococcus equi subsp. equi]|nr:hypothetical protein [Streptococcus equi subsp. equi]
MKLGKIKIGLLAIVASTLLISSLVIAERQIGYLQNFRITSFFGRTKDYLVKSAAPYYVVNLDSRGRNREIVVRHYLANSNGQRRSDIDKTWTGDRGIYTQDTKSGYLYALHLVRENWWDGATTISGSWSPDNW